MVDPAVSSPEPGPGSVASNPVHQLARLEDQVSAMRAVLVRLLQEVVQAEARLGDNRADLLTAANEQLVVAAISHQTDADKAVRALFDASRTVGVDPRTQLPNRLLLADRFTRAIAGAKRRNSPLAVLVVDLNGFESINDTLGHAMGDCVLQSAAQRLVAAVREVDTVSRHNGDEFVILLTEVARAADATLVADKVIAALARPTRCDGHVLRLNCSIGIAQYPEDGSDMQTLMESADTAMLAAKAHGPSSCVVHAGRALARDTTHPAIKSLQRPITQDQQAQTEHDLQYALLQEANEKLVLSALDAQELQSAAETAQQRQMEFLAVIAHELRNPLAPIRLATSMLGRIRTDEPLLPRAQAIIERQTVQLTRLITDLVDVTRTQTDKLHLSLGVVDIVDVIDEAIEASRPAMDTRLQALDVKVPSHALRLRGDFGRLVQVITNLLNNASKYTPNGGAIALTVAVDGDALVLTLDDNGIGISPDMLPSIFDPFVQDGHAIGFNGVGLGVGLTVARELIQGHGGTITASSAGRGRGSRFSVRLPLLEPSAAPQVD